MSWDETVGVLAHKQPHPILAELGFRASASSCLAFADDKKNAPHCGAFLVELRCFRLLIDRGFRDFS
jgi:hypothetical protein